MTSFINYVIVPSCIYLNPTISLQLNDKITNYHPDIRFEQTKSTIQSIRDKIPNSYIIFLDCGPLTPEQNEYFLNNVEYFESGKNDDFLYNQVYHSSNRKSMGERAYILKAILHFNEIKAKSTIFNECTNIFKVGGRYSLNKDFDYSKYNCSLDVLRTCYTLANHPCWSSCFKISLKNLNSFYTMLNSDYYQQKFNSINMEEFMRDYKLTLNNNYYEIDILGITALIVSSTGIEYQ